MAAAVKTYSLWVMPKGPLAGKLQAEIKWLATQVPQAPLFMPHVTLLGGIRAAEDDVLATAASLAKQLKPYRITFDRVASGAIFHQCVYLLCQSDPGTLHAGKAARESFEQDPDGLYMPHLSLLYSDISDEERKRIVAHEQQRLLEGQSPLLQREDLGFDVSSLTVWETEGSDRTLLSWRQLAEYPLEGH